MSKVAVATHDSIDRFEVGADQMAERASARPGLAAALMMAGVVASSPVMAGAWFADAEAILDQGKVSTTLDIDNDSIPYRHYDGYYTSGVRVTRNHRLREAGGWRSVAWRIGQQVYTPRHVTTPPELLGPLDRPYAGWLYGGASYRIEADDGSELAWGLDLGCLGPCAGGAATQKLIHRLMNQPRPQGWGTQLSTEPGLVVHVGARVPAYRLAAFADVRPGVALRAGNIFTDLMLDTSLRAGRLRAAAGEAVAYGFLRAGVRIVGYDATLQGGLFASDPGRTVRPRRTTGELEAGVQWQRAAWALRVSLVGRTNEIDGLPESQGRESFVRLSISYSP